MNERPNESITQPTVEQLQQQILQMEQQHQQELRHLQFEAMLSLEIYKAKGRNEKAIKALLDVEELQKSDQPEQAIRTALEQLKKECSYLFDTAATTMYATGTAAQPPEQTAHTALRAAFGLPL